MNDIDNLTDEEQAEFQDFIKKSKQAAKDVAKAVSDRDPRLAIPAAVLFLAATVIQQTEEGRFESIEEAVHHVADGVYLAVQDILKGPAHGEAVN